MVQSWPRAEWFQAGSSLAVHRLTLNPTITRHPENMFTSELISFLMNEADMVFGSVLRLEVSEGSGAAIVLLSPSPRLPPQ